MSTDLLAEQNHLDLLAGVESRVSMTTKTSTDPRGQGASEREMTTMLVFNENLTRSIGMYTDAGSDTRGHSNVKKHTPGRAPNVPWPRPTRSPLNL